MKLLAVTDDRHSVCKLASMIIQIKDIVDFIHIREKSKTSAELMSLLKLLENGKVDMAKMVINDRLDIACDKNIPTVHLPGHGLPVKMVRAKFPYLRIGRSVHSFEEAREAKDDGADYVLYGHVFETNSKKGKPPRGTSELTKIKKTLQIPVYAIGGITPARIKEIHQTKADGIAIMSGIFSADNPAAAAERLLEICLGEKNEKNF
ncbi:thiazole tautomerase TenI [Peribacillus saganii]|uniref:Thiazole tautomerase TenI n=1 Tax=Peribacillus saganii TaxID=2303992 RepID=A0A372LLN1_9BACI|nr:thiazole tautomerase TenI [Peribacillus saganii]RFU67520.1 thiazole tautomerase TenI [Peribacillus saganii]